MEHLVLLLHALMASAKFCGRTKAPFELGHWHGRLKHLDSATIENSAVSVAEGQFYVYENTFPEHTIKYLNVDNVAQRTCGASATLKRGGVGQSSVLLILHAEPNNEIRSVIEVWGTRDVVWKRKKMPLKKQGMEHMRSRYLFSGVRVLNHNQRLDSDSY